MLHATLSSPVLDDAFGVAWEADVARWGASPFVSWGWVGCLAGERFPDPVLAEVRDGDAVVGRALFNRRRGRLGVSYHLHESGDPALDAVFTEHNGVLAQPGQAAAVLGAVLRALGGAGSRVVLSGIDDAALAAARAAGVVWPVQTRVAPFARLEAGVPFAGGLSRNTGAQVRRSDRSYAASGPIEVRRAATAGEAEAWLERLVALHGATWSGRGLASGFMAAPVQRFHRALLGRALLGREVVGREVAGRGVGRGVVEVLLVAAGAREIGYLLNLRAGGRVCAYQSGFDYAGAGVHEKPGFTSHVAAAEAARLGGAVEYDFLAGDARYKRSLSNDVRRLHWVGWQRGASLPGVVAGVVRLFGR